MDCVKCLMLIDDKTKCDCDPLVCCNCCDCGEDCDGCDCSTCFCGEDKKSN